MEPERTIRDWLDQNAQIIEGPTYTMGVLPDGRSVLWVNEGGKAEPTGSDDVTVSLADDATWYFLRDLLHIDPVSLEGV